jgi:hypothetical protein
MNKRGVAPAGPVGEFVSGTTFRLEIVYFFPIA